MPFITTKTLPWPENIPYDKQGVPVPGTKRPGQTAHYRNGIWGLVGLDTPNSLKTLDEIFQTGLTAGGDQPCLGRRPVVSTNPIKYANRYVWETYAEVDLRRRFVGSALCTLFAQGELGVGELDTVGLWSLNRPEWQMIDIALQSYNKITVSLYDTLGKDSVEYILNHSNLTVIFSTPDHIPTLLKLKSRVPNLKLIVSIDELAPESSSILKEWGATQSVKIMELREFEAFGKANLMEPIPAQPEQIASICYTSGTTGNPKGVILTHSNLALSIQSNLMGVQIPADACCLSYLPLAHIYERACELCTIAVGGKIGYFTGNPLRLLEDAQLLKPNFFPSVPRVLNRIYHAALAAGKAPGLKGALFRKALQTKLDRLHTNGHTTHPLWDRLVFRKIQAVLGGEVMLLSTGSAPISPDVLDFLKISFPYEVTEETRYGLTETCATCAKVWPGDRTSSGLVGPPQPINEIKLVDVVSMGYTSEDKPNPRGELYIRGANCFKAYLKDEKSTRETVDEEGWIHTGDVAEIDQVGRIKIIDRIKNITKLAQGEYVALEKIENVYSVSALVAQLYVHADSLQSYIVAVVVPDLVPFASIVSSITNKQVAAENLQELTVACRDERVNKQVLAVLNQEAQRSGLIGYETIKRIHLSLDPFTVEDETLTPTFKIRRKNAYLKFKAEIDQLYTLSEPTSRL